MKSEVFLRNGLRYDESLQRIMPALVEFWQTVDTNFPRNQTVLIKPNLLSPHKPEAAITTHPVLVRHVCSILQEHNNRVLIADSPAGTHNRHMQKLWAETGMKRVAEQTGAELLDLNKRGLIKKSGITRHFFASEILDEVDYVINLPKLKTHGLTFLTGGIKNVFGLIPGIQKGEYHIRYPKPVDFADVIAEIHAAIRPNFTIMDGIEILEGNGPSSGGQKKYLGTLLAGLDAVAVDATAARSLGINPHIVDLIRLAEEKGIGRAKTEDILLNGEMISQRIEIPSSHVFNHLPASILWVLKKVIWTRPRANPENCTRCGICIQNCPAKAMRPGPDRLPVIDYDTCIHCFCCAEVCPDDAIYQELSRLVKKLS